MNNSNERKLSEVFSAIVNSCAQARSSTDLTALKIAELYNRNEFLKGLPIPRLRFQNIKISMPLIVNELIPAKKAKMNSVDYIVEKINKELYEFSKLMYEVLETKNVHKFLNEDEREDLEQLIKLFSEVSSPESNKETKVNSSDENTDWLNFGKQLSQELKIAFYDFNQLLEYETPSDDYIDDALSDLAIMRKVEKITKKSFEKFLKTLLFETIKQNVENKSKEFDEKRAQDSIKKIIDSHYIQNFLNSIGRMAATLSIAENTVSPDFKVTVNTDDVKNSGGGTRNITRIEMTLLEEGLEWVTESDNGEKTSKLMKE